MKVWAPSGRATPSTLASTPRWAATMPVPASTMMRDTRYAKSPLTMARRQARFSSRRAVLSLSPTSIASPSSSTSDVWVSSVSVAVEVIREAATGRDGAERTYHGPLRAPTAGAEDQWAVRRRARRRRAG